MKLKLVREDGSDATIEDLCSAFTDAVDIDGVSCRLTEYEGPDGKDDPWEAGDGVGELRVTLTYANRRRMDGVARSNGRSDVSYRYDCAFSHRRRLRERTR